MTSHWATSLSQALSASSECELRCDEWLTENNPGGVVVASDAEPDERNSSRVMLVRHWSDLSPATPAVGVRVHRNAICYGGAITRRDGKWHEGGQLVLDERRSLVPASYSAMDGNATLPRDLLFDDLSLRAPEPSEFLPGAHYLVGSVHRHFGHMMLEGVSRLWALKALTDAKVGLLIYEDLLKPYAVALFEELGIGSERLRPIPRRGVRVELLVAPDVSISTHRRIASVHATTYAQVRPGRSTRTDRKVFLSRRHVPERPLLNIDEIEQLFEKAQFEIVHPEQLSIPQQVDLARECSVLAGPVGSQMYLAAFQPRNARTLVFAPANFCLKDDYLLALAGERELRMATGSSVRLDFSKELRSWRIQADTVRRLLEV